MKLFGEMSYEDIALFILTEATARGGITETCTFEDDMGHSFTSTDIFSLSEIERFNKSIENGEAVC